MPKQSKSLNRYEALIEKIFFDHYQEGLIEFEFARTEIETGAKILGINLPKNIGDVIYSFRYRATLPQKIIETQPEGMTWIIEGVGRSRYCFRLVRLNLIVPNQNLVQIKIPDATPELIAMYALDDEQALLAKVRYNRLVDIFLGITAYSMQNHLRTTIRGGIQIEIDELYFGIDKYGCHYVIPAQAKGGTDRISVVQTKQDILFCSEKFPGIRCRALSAQFMPADTIAMFELTVIDDEVQIVEEKHYKLVSAQELDRRDIQNYHLI